MKVKLDEGLSVSLAERLAKHGIDADAVYPTSRSLPFCGSLGVRFPPGDPTRRGTASC